MGLVVSNVFKLEHTIKLLSWFGYLWVHPGLTSFCPINWEQVSQDERAYQPAKNRGLGIGEVLKPMMSITAYKDGIEQLSPFFCLWQCIFLRKHEHTLND
ncbi:hypothetical protein MA16_Dca028188 [Dendrobium catenatum]|uniref:Uncharacterized protein n=1 Tax=Dendrobium catenatum TaxID=906689 RepID=A0A2I0VDB9_9ASPA|nr:hypothetical protein MA16_Dca028188 [Dendrobium catenatum]